MVKDINDLFLVSIKERDAENYSRQREMLIKIKRLANSSTTVAAEKL